MTDVVTSEYTEIRLEPPAGEWSDYIRINTFENSRLTELRNSARSRLVAAAEQFVQKLNSLADDADLSTSGIDVLTGDPARQPIVMTGHQPIVFHGGLTFKYETTEQFAADNNALAVAVVIDTDLGDAGRFSYPESPDGSAALAIDSLATSENLYLYGKLRDAQDLAAVSEKLGRQLRQLEQPEAAEFVESAVRQYSGLASARVGAAEANLIMRRYHGIGRRMLEVPLSAVSSFPESLQLTADILKQPKRFAAAYNSALDLYRDENSIRNAANPFPNLKIDGDTCELPFWVIGHDRGRRYMLEAQVNGNDTRLIANGKTIDTFTGNITAETLEPMLVQNIQIVPRGALITAFLRLLVSDVFVHGTGGGRYDRFTDEFIRSWWNVEPTPFMIASASRYLFADRREELERLENVKSSMRDLQFNPQRHFGSGVFSDAAESRLTDLVRQKDEAVAQMKATHAQGASARETGRRIQQLTNQIKNAVADEFEPQLSALQACSPEQLDAVHCRTYPWFMFR